MEMTDDLVHLHPAYRSYAALSTDERIQWTRHDRWISYERAEQILLRLADLLTYPPRDRMPALLIFGATGMGKTRIIQKFLRDHRSDFDEVTGITRLPLARCPRRRPSATSTKSCSSRWARSCQQD